MSPSPLAWLLPVGLVVLFGTPVLSSLDNLLNFPRMQNFTDYYWLATGLVSAIIGAVYFARHLSDPVSSPKTTERRHSGATKHTSVRQQNSLDGQSEYPQVYFTATRPASVNVKPMLRLSTEIESFVDRIDKYTDNLETILTDRTSELGKYKSQLDGLLHQLLPPSIAGKFSGGERVLPASFDCVTVYYCDIVGYTTIVAQSSAVEMVEFLNALYRMTDAVVENYDAYKVETIGDADLIASGIPIPNGEKHASEVAKLSLHMLRSFAGFCLPHRPSESPRIRVGLHSGKCMAGIVGSKIPKYVLFGDAVSTATKLECTSEPGRIQISAATADLLKETGNFVLEPRGLINLKGSPKFETFWLQSYKE